MISRRKFRAPFLQISVLLMIGGALVLYLSRYTPNSALIQFARDLHFRYPVQRWQLHLLQIKIELIRDAVWFCGGGLIIAGLLILLGRPARLRRFIEKIASSRFPAILFFLLTLQFIVVSLFLVTERRFWSSSMYNEFSPGSVEQRNFLCGREYLHAMRISEYFHKEDHVLLAGEQIHPFFLNYYLYPVYLYQYDNRPISEYEIFTPYVRRWLYGKNINYVLAYTPFSEVPWSIFKTRNNAK